MNKTALLSVWDKRGLVPLAQRLAAAGWRLIASGGTGRALAEAGLEVSPVQEITGEPELFGGRVKTLHPALHAGILAPDTPEARQILQRKGWPWIDLVVVNLYPFQDVANKPETTLSQAIELIDIGGAALLRAAAKNYQRVSVVCDPGDYPQDLTKLDQRAYRMKLARKVFSTTAAYDAAIARYFGEPGSKVRKLYPGQALRYGENPHQKAVFYSTEPGGTPFHGRVLAGRALSYNNLLDLEGAWRAVQRFQNPAAVVVKHTSPCGIAVAEHVADALSLAIASDPVSAFGSVIASNRPVDRAFGKALGDLYVECLAAPGFTEKAREKLQKREKLRLIEIPEERSLPSRELRSIPGGYLEQNADYIDPVQGESWDVVTKRAPSQRELAALRFAWKAVMDVKSNAVLLAKAEEERRFTVGIGGGQPNRVDCVRLAGERAGERAAGSVLASDAFFPFPDGIRAAHELGVTAVVQPGGSIRDQDVIQEANRLGLSMIFTGVRHFRH
jgi:phosphoribosylaminoimidazolecarboxamide formyltransferase/IMP cyclohydrolase